MQGGQVRIGWRNKWSLGVNSSFAVGCSNGRMNFSLWKVLGISFTCIGKLCPSTKSPQNPEQVTCYSFKTKQWEATTLRMNHNQGGRGGYPICPFMVNKWSIRYLITTSPCRWRLWWNVQCCRVFIRKTFPELCVVSSIVHLKLKYHTCINDVTIL